LRPDIFDDVVALKDPSKTISNQANLKDEQQEYLNKLYNLFCEELCIGMERLWFLWLQNFAKSEDIEFPENWGYQTDSWTKIALPNNHWLDIVAKPPTEGKPKQVYESEITASQVVTDYTQVTPLTQSSKWMSPNLIIFDKSTYLCYHPTDTEGKGMKLWESGVPFDHKQYSQQLLDGVLQKDPETHLAGTETPEYFLDDENNYVPHSEDVSESHQQLVHDSSFIKDVSKTILPATAIVESNIENLSSNIRNLDSQ